VTPTLFIDGDCALCTRTAWFIDKRDRVRTLRFVALESDEGRALRAERPELASIDSLIWVERADDGHYDSILTHSDAVLAVGRYLGRGWRLLALLARPIPVAWRDGIYRLVARHRTRF
jgi:predicted DCC family thiol-disulfide oxidoreductase YuxK